MTKSIEIKFGYWPRNWNLSARGIQVEPLPEFGKVVDGINTSNRVADQWLYPPLTPAYTTGPASEERPSVHAQSFTIRPTHVMRVENETDGRDFGELVIALLGLLEGMRLIPEGWCHFYRTAIKPQTLSDLGCERTDIEEVLRIAESFWETHQGPAVRRCLFGAIHWHLFSQSYQHPFEEFAAQYIVLDSCFKLHSSINRNTKNMPHSKRPSFLAQAYGIPEPSWATMKSNSTCDLSQLRNEFFHEGLYGGHPIGFAYSPNVLSTTLQLKNFNTRLILGILGVDCEYVRSRVDTRGLYYIGLAKH